MGSLENARTRIEWAYNRYREGKDRDGSLADLVECFCIPISYFDISLDDSDSYYLESIDLDAMSIVIVDKGAGTRYEAEYTNRVDAFGVKVNNMSFIHVKSSNNLREVESLYHISDMTVSEEDRHIATRITARKGTFELVLMAVENHSLDHTAVGKDFMVEYNRIFQDEKYGEKKQNLFTKRSKKSCNGGNVFFDHVYNYGLTHSSLNGDEVDCFTYFASSGVDYYVNDVNVKRQNNLEEAQLVPFFGNKRARLQGVCFENLDSHWHDDFHFPTGMESLNAKKCPELYDVKTKSMLLFQGSTFSVKCCDIKIYKTTSGINVVYREQKEGARKVPTIGFCLPCLTPGNISIEELNSVVNRLSEYAGNDFIKQVIIQLCLFRKKMCINRGLTVEDEALSPYTLIDKPVEEIEKMVTEDKDACFDVIERQFAASTNLDGVLLSDIKSFRIVPKDRFV